MGRCYIFLQLSAISLLLFFFPSSVLSYQNISIGSSLTPLGPNKSWLSPSGDFAFGFLPLDTNSNTFLLAIWFAKIPNNTVVWYANGDNPVNSRAQLKLTDKGQLLLTDGAGNSVWNSSNTSISTTHATMLDTGNFILVAADGSSSWESFAHPSDTILPSQALNPGTKLVARLMDNDYSSGRFELSFSSDGNLGLYTVAQPLGAQYDAYWTSGTGGNGTQLIFNVSGTIYVSLRDNSSVFKVTSFTNTTPQDFYQRATLDADGVFRQYVYPRNVTESSGVWSAEWTALIDFVPTDICQAISADNGSGACGFNSLCVIEPGDYQQVGCQCPPQYKFIDPDRKYKGCIPDFSTQNCVANESETEQLFRLEQMINVDWPLSDYEQYNSVDEITCMKQCLTDCFCAVAIYNQGNCSKKRLPLSNGRVGSSVGKTALIKVAINDISTPDQLSLAAKDKNKTWKVLSSTLLGSSLFVNFLFILAIVITCFSTRTLRVRSAPSSSILSLQSFSYDELEQITDGFGEELGSSPFGIVYKGFLQDDARTCVAVMKLDKIPADEEDEFINEIKAIGKTCHKNLVKLLGFCNKGDKKLLVYEFMSNGTLAQFLFGDVKPEWNIQVQISLDIARGLTYLHEECTTQIIHCQLTPESILLDDNLVAKVADYGLAKLLRTDKIQSNSKTNRAGIYVAPEWFRSRSMTAMSDVYSFGMVLLEIICCRRNSEPGLQNDEQQKRLSYWVDNCYRTGRLDLVICNDEVAVYDMKRVERFVKVALWCIQEEPSLRPTMTKVTQMLDGASTVPTPPELDSYISSIQ